MNLVELIASKCEQYQSLCKFGNIVSGHACYCHHPKGLRKCPIWREYGENPEKWHSKGDWEKDKWNGGCKYFIAS